MTESEAGVAERLALSLADVFCTAIPALFAEPPEAVVSVTLPLAQALVRAEAKAARNAKHARRYRRLRQEVRELLRAEPDAPAPVRALAATVPFDPAAWHTELCPGAGHETAEAPRGTA